MAIILNYLHFAKCKTPMGIKIKIAKLCHKLIDHEEPRNMVFLHSVFWRDILSIQMLHAPMALRTPLGTAAAQQMHDDTWFSLPSYPHRLDISIVKGIK